MYTQRLTTWRHSHSTTYPGLHPRHLDGNKQEVPFQAKVQQAEWAQWYCFWPLSSSGRNALKMR